MMLSPYVDRYTKTLNHRKILGKPTKKQLIKGILKPKNKLRWGPVFVFSFPGGIRPSAPRQVRHE